MMTGALASVLLLPRNVAVLILRGYRAVISPLYGDVCRYYPSCTAYALAAIQEYGVVVGTVLSLRRVAKCHPWATGGIDDVPKRTRRRYAVTKFGFVIANTQRRG